MTVETQGDVAGDAEDLKESDAQGSVEGEAPASGEPQTTDAAASSPTDGGQAAAPGEGAKENGAEGTDDGRPAVPDSAKLLAQLEMYRKELLGIRTQLKQRDSELEMSRKMAQDTLQKLKDEHELRVRAAADLENYRRRSIKEREDNAKFGQERLVKSLLPILDNLERALDPKNCVEVGPLRQGVEMTFRGFESVLAGIGVKGFSAVGQQFDPSLHEAMQAVESDEPPNTVIAQMVRGFKMHDRLIRPAMVFVAKARPEAAASAEKAESAAVEGDDGAPEEACSSGGDKAETVSAPEPSGDAPADATAETTA